MAEGVVIVVGAGIAGLAAAVALNKVRYRTLIRVEALALNGLKVSFYAQVGIPVKVLEKSGDLRVEGASINIATNGWKAMQALEVARTLRDRSCSIER